MPIYNTDVESSFLQALGPFKIQVTGESSSGTIVPKSIDFNKPEIKDDPIQSLAELLRDMPGSQEDWEALINEPYY